MLEMPMRAGGNGASTQPRSSPAACGNPQPHSAASALLPEQPTAATRQTLDITSCHVSADAADPGRAVGMLSASKDGTVVEWAFDWKRRGRDEERGREIVRWRGGFLGEGKR